MIFFYSKCSRNTSGADSKAIIEKLLPESILLYSLRPLRSLRLKNYRKGSQRNSSEFYLWYNSNRDFLVSPKITAEGQG